MQDGRNEKATQAREPATRRDAHSRALRSSVDDKVSDEDMERRGLLFIAGKT